MTQLVPILLLALGAFWWWSAMRARESATRAARRACETFGTQLLDETVVLRQLRPRRDAAGRLCLRRIYGFEFTRSGGERDKGYATLMGHRVTGVHLDAVDSEPTGRHMLH